MNKIENYTATVLYKNDENAVICSLKLSQKSINDPSVIIESPEIIIKPRLVKITSQNTLHHFLIHPIMNGSFIDYINSIALCLIKSGIPCEILVGASEENCIMVYSVESDTVEYFYSKNLVDQSILNTLKSKCIKKYEELTRL